MALLDSQSQGQKLFADTMLSKAEGDMFDSVAMMYGLPRIKPTNIKYWRPATLRAAFGRRSTRGVIFGFLREALRGQDQTYTVKVDSAPAKQSNIYWVAGGPSAGFREKDLFRYWEVAGIVYFSMPIGGAAPDLYSSGNPGASMLLAPWKSAQWAGGKGVSAGAPINQWTNKTAYRLPFVVQGNARNLKVYIEWQQSVPPTFFQDAYVSTIDSSGYGPMAQVPVGMQPEPGGHEIANVPLSLEVGFKVDQNLTFNALIFSEEQHVYSSLTAAMTDASTVADIIDANPMPNSGTAVINGKRFTYAGKVSTPETNPPVQRLTGCAIVVDDKDGLPIPTDSEVVVSVVPARGGTFTAMMYKNGNPTALTCVLGAAQTSHKDTAHEVTAVADDIISFRITAIGAGTNTPLQWPRITALTKRPAGEPEGGDFAPDDVADDPNIGPWPIYLGGDFVDTEWTNFIQAMAAADVYVQVYRIEDIHNV